MTGWCLACRAPRITPGREPLSLWVCPVCRAPLHGPTDYRVRAVQARPEDGEAIDPWAKAVPRVAP